MIRPARIFDRRAVLELADEWTALYPYLKPDRDRMSILFRTAVSQPSTHYAAVVQDGDDVTGCIAAMQGQNVWARKNHMAILLWVSKTPGEGARLLRMFKRWTDTRPTVRLAGFHPDIDVDPRALKLAERIGFKRYGGAQIYYKGA